MLQALPFLVSLFLIPGLQSARLPAAMLGLVSRGQPLSTSHDLFKKILDNSLIKIAFIPIITVFK